MHEDEVLFTEFFNKKLKDRGLTLKHLSSATGIAMKHLENFSHGRFENLPSAPYVHGYFVKLGKLLDFDPDEWWSRIKEEDTVHRAGAKDKMPKNRFSGFRGRALIWGGIALALVAVYFGARLTTIIGEPRIILAAPAEGVDYVFQGVLTFAGRVENGDTLSIYNNSVPLAADGSFRADVTLSPGMNQIELRARKTLGREAVLTRHIYYEAPPVILPGV